MKIFVCVITRLSLEVVLSVYRDTPVISFWAYFISSPFSQGSCSVLPLFRMLILDLAAISLTCACSFFRTSSTEGTYLELLLHKALYQCCFVLVCIFKYKID